MEHKDIPDNQRHEVKGASTASSGTFLKARGDGTTEFSAINLANIEDFNKMASVSPLVTSDVADVVEAFNNLISSLKQSGLML